MTQPTIPNDQEKTRNWLASLMLRRHESVMSRFARVYAQLAERPRGWRRRLQRKLAITAAGAALILAMAGLGSLPQFNARAATGNVITVANGEVKTSKNGKCALIEAINNANDTNDGQGNGDCAAGDPNGPDTIVLPEGGLFTVNNYVNYDYGYSALPLITSTITVEGNGSTITRSGKKDMRFFTVVTYYEDEGNLTLNDLTMTNGANEYYSGGAIYAYGATVTLNNCTLTGNSSGGNGGAIFTTYTNLTINDSTIDDNTSYGGGGLYAGYGEVTIVNSSISGNTAPESSAGAAYITSADLLIDNSVIDGNESYYAGGLTLSLTSFIINDSEITGNKSTNYEGGGIYILDATGIINHTKIAGNEGTYGGGMFVYFGDVAVNNSTISDNKAVNGAGFYSWSDSKVTINNSTISGNTASGSGGGAAGTGEMVFNNATISDNSAASGGGINVINGTATLRQTLVAGNTAPTGREIQRQAGTVTLNAHNLFGFNGNGGLDGVSAGATDVVPGAGVGIAAVLSPLADNTGATETHALPSGSPAIDRAPNASCTAAPILGLDQRAQPRNVNGNGAASAEECDIGAYEFQPSGEVETPTATATSDATNTPSPTPTELVPVTLTPTGTITVVATPSPTSTVESGPTATPTITTTPGALDYDAFMPAVLKD